MSLMRGVQGLLLIVIGMVLNNLIRDIRQARHDTFARKHIMTDVVAATLVITALALVLVFAT